MPERSGCLQMENDSLTVKIAGLRILVFNELTLAEMWNAFDAQKFREKVEQHLRNAWVGTRRMKDLIALQKKQTGS